MSNKILNRLIYLAALTGAAQYVIPGALASGATLASFPTWFLIADYALWAVRAFVEASVIVALFQVEPKTARHSRLLLAFEVALIALITLTLGPALYALGRGLTMAATLGAGAFLAWNLAIASYAPLMMAASGAAYRVAMYTPPLPPLPVIPARVADENPGASYEELLQAPAVDDLRELQAVPAPAPFPATVQRGKRAQIRALHAQHPEWSNAQLAQAAGCHISTVGRAL